MNKNKITFKCSACNYQTLKWIGCCPECRQWNSFTQIKALESPTKNMTPAIAMVQLKDVSTQQKERMFSGIKEWDRVVGNGIMPSSLLILTGDPGIGKSTLLLQVSNRLAKKYVVHYFSTEESLQQVRERAKRLGCLSSNLLFSNQAQLETIIAMSKQEKPDMLIIDSIQNCYSSNAQTLPGSVSQLREAAFHLMRLAKEDNVTIIVSGHINKDGNIAGPKTLEHIVDAVFYLQGEDRWQTRVLRSVKNRFGTMNELGFFEMRQSGLEEVGNINEQLLSEASGSPGSVLISLIEGSRPLLLELQALTIESKLNIPQRIISGLDHKQVVLIAAILEKHLHIKLSSQDIFFKVSGGFKIKGSSTDLGIALALLSSYFQQPLPEKSIVLGEISLAGQIKPINQINLFIREAEKFGIKELFIAKNQILEQEKNKKSSIKRFANVYELLSLFTE